MADLVDLHRAIVAGQSFQVQRAAAKLINSGKHIDLAVEASVAALLNEDKWDEAIIACNVRPELQFQKAYALYKKERFAEALAIVTSAEDGASAARWQHLHGQILFRLGRHREAAAQYDAIATALVALGSDADPIDLADAQTNLVATLVASDAPARAVSHAALLPVVEAVRSGKPASPDEPPELYFNLACALAEAGEPGEGLRAIGTGLAAARSTLASDGADAATIADALAPLLAQAAYILQLCRFDDAAAAAYRAVGRPADPLLAAAVSANASLIGRAPRDVLAAFKAFRALLGARAVLDRATPAQTAVLRLDAGVLALRCGRAAETFAAPPAGSAAAATPDTSGGSALAALLQATTAVIAAAPSATGAPLSPSLGAALADLAAASRSGAGVDVPVAALCSAQLLVAAGQLAAAATAIAEATGCGAPAAACAVAALRASAGDTPGALAALDACVAAQEQRQQAGQAGNGLATALLMRAALRSASSLGSASADLAAVAALPGASTEQRAAALASTALAALQAGRGGPDASSRTAACAEAAKLIREASALVAAPPAAAAAVDLDALEWPAAEPARRRASSASSAASTAAPSDAASTAGGAAAAAAPSAAKLAKKRRALARRARLRVAHLEKLRARGAAGTLFAGSGAAATLPPPDPERWLPRRLRTYGKKSRRRAIGKAAVNVSSGGAQGSAVAEGLTASLDAKAKADAAKAAPPPAPAPAPAPKKGKGRK